MLRSLLFWIVFIVLCHAASMAISSTPPIVSAILTVRLSLPITKIMDIILAWLTNTIKFTMNCFTWLKPIERMINTAFAWPTTIVAQWIRTVYIWSLSLLSPHDPDLGGMGSFRPGSLVQRFIWLLTLARNNRDLYIRNLDRWLHGNERTLVRYLLSRIARWIFPLGRRVLMFITCQILVVHVVRMVGHLGLQTVIAVASIAVYNIHKTGALLFLVGDFLRHVFVIVISQLVVNFFLNRRYVNLPDWLVVRRHRDMIFEEIFAWNIWMLDQWFGEQLPTAAFAIILWPALYHKLTGRAPQQHIAIGCLIFKDLVAQYFSTGVLQWSHSIAFCLSLLLSVCMLLYSDHEARPTVLQGPESLPHGLRYGPVPQRRPADDGEQECAVCREVLDFSKPETITWCKISCGNSLHVKCALDWYEAQGLMVKCCHCMARWIPLPRWADY